MHKQKYVQPQQALQAGFNILCVLVKDMEFIESLCIWQHSCSNQGLKDNKPHPLNDTAGHIKPPCAVAGRRVALPRLHLAQHHGRSGVWQQDADKPGAVVAVTHAVEGRQFADKLKAEVASDHQAATGIEGVKPNVNISRPACSCQACP